MDCGDDFGKFWKFTKNHSIIHLKWMNFTIYKLFLNKAVFAKKINNHMGKNQRTGATKYI